MYRNRVKPAYKEIYPVLLIEYIFTGNIPRNCVKAREYNGCHYADRQKGPGYVIISNDN